MAQAGVCQGSMQACIIRGQQLEANRLQGDRDFLGRGAKQWAAIHAAWHQD